MNNLTPKEKAEKLLNKYTFQIEGIDNYNFVLNTKIKFIAKQCALIAVYEIINLDDFSIEGREYWEEVKNEIEKL